MKNHSQAGDRKSTRLNSSHSQISDAVFCLKKKIKKTLIQAKGRPPHGATYKLIDGKVKPGKTYYYKLEDIDRNGTKTLHLSKGVKGSLKKKQFFPPRLFAD